MKQSYRNIQGRKAGGKDERIIKTKSFYQPKTGYSLTNTERNLAVAIKHEI